MLVLGNRDERIQITGGYGIFCGVDIRVFSKKSGLTITFELANPGQRSLRLWLGIFSMKLG